MEKMLKSRCHKGQTGVVLAQLDTTANSLSLPERGEGWGGHLNLKTVRLLTPAPSSLGGGGRKMVVVRSFGRVVGSWK
jgi:hypothetical protein